MGVLLWALRSLASSLLGTVIFVSFLALLIINSLSGKLLNDEFYARALASENAYARVYDEILMEPQVRQEIQAALGNADLISYQDLLQVLRDVAPPEYLQAQTERAIGSSVDYLAGDAAAWTAYIELGPALDQVKPAVFRLVDRRIDVVPLAQPDPQKSPEQQLLDLSRQADAFFTALAKGQVPSVVPSIQGIPEPVRGTVFDSFMAGLLNRPDLDLAVQQGLRASIKELRAAFVAGDTRQVAKVAARAALTPALDQALAQVRSRLDAQARVDLVALVRGTEGGNQALAQLQPQVERARRWTVRLPLLGLLALAGVAGGAFLMGLVHLPRLSRTLGWPGFALLTTGATFFGLSKVMESALLDRLDRLMDSSAARLSGAPPSVLDLGTDVAGALAQQLSEGFVTPALTIMAVGAALLVAAMLAFLMDRKSMSAD